MTPVGERLVSLIIAPHARLHRKLRERVYVPVSVFVILCDLVGRVPIVASGGVLIGLSSIVWYFVRRRRAKIEAEKYMDRKGDPLLVCRGNAWELRPLERLNVQFFEPVVVSSQPPWLAATEVAAVIPLGLGIYAFLLIRGMGIGFAAAGAMFPILLIQVALRLTFLWYYRISPGRMEVLRTGFFRKNLRLKSSVALNGAGVGCYYDRMRLVIRECGEAGRTVNISLHDVSTPNLLVEAVFRGVVCGVPAPRLPHDKLVG